MSEPANQEEAMRRAAEVRLLLLDADGVLTDGSLFYGGDGTDIRAFHVRDGLGIRLGQRHGLAFGIISGRRSLAVAERAAELDIVEVHQGAEDKVATLDEILRKLGMRREQAGFVGDDLPDLPVMRRVGFSAAPADAEPTVRRQADLVTDRPGGRGAVREVIEFVLRATGRESEMIERFSK